MREVTSTPREPEINIDAAVMLPTAEGGRGAARAATTAAAVPGRVAAALLRAARTAGAVGGGGGGASLWAFAGRASGTRAMLLAMALEILQLMLLAMLQALGAEREDDLVGKGKVPLIPA